MLFELFEKLKNTSACFIQILRETILLRINNIRNNVWDNRGFNLGLQRIVHWQICLITLYNANSLKIPLNYLSFVSVV